MVNRKCVNCHKDVDLPHVRVWEEGVEVSRMLTFCSIQCMWEHYTTDNGHCVEEYLK